MTASPRFGIAVVTYNPDAAVVRRMADYAATTDALLVRDNSDAPSPVCDKIAVLASDYSSYGMNVGISRALNDLVDRAISLGLDYLVTMDQDSDLSGVNLTRLVELAEADNDHATALYCPNFRKVYSDAGRESYGPTAIGRSEVRYRHYAMTSGSVLVLSRVGDLFPIPDLFVGYVDRGLCCDLGLRGLRVKMFGEVIMNQRVGSLVASTWLNKRFHVIRHTNSRYYYMGRNNRILQTRYTGHARIRVSLNIDLARILANILLAERGRPAKLRALMQGWRDGGLGILGEMPRARVVDNV